MKLFKKSSRNISMILYLLFLILDCISNIAVINISYDLVWTNNSANTKMLMYILIVKAFLYVILFYLKRKNENLHGKFKNKIRREFIEAIFLTKNIDDSKHTGELTTDLWIGIEWMGVYYFEALPDLIFKLTLLICGTLYMLYVNYKLAFLFVATLAIIFLLEKIFDPLISKSSQSEGQINEEYSMMSMDALNGSETLKSLNGVDFYKSKLKNKSKLLKQASMGFVYLTTLSQLFKDVVLNIIKLLSLIILFRYMIIKKLDMNIVITNAFILFIIYNSISTLHGSFLKMAKAKVYKEKISTYIKCSENYRSLDKSDKIISDSDYIVFTEDLSYKYPQSKGRVLKNINLRIKEGHKLALIGSSGSGKSTIIKCLSGFLNNFQGEAFVFGLNIAETENLKKIKSKMCIILQKNHIFSNSVFENIRISKKNATEDEVIDALKKANIYDFISSLSDGIYTKIGEGGFELSGGQKSRIAIARAFLRNASIILLDEPTSSLDRENEFRIISNLKELFKGRTVIQTAHRLETIKDFDEISYMECGQIIHSGNHEELISISSEYREYFNRLGDDMAYEE
ncbi:ABC transporter ATP-binding protein [Treponema phagedenis]|uniref:ABC transporter ATP-binding protein n=1 Tax=Treponema phagedenis TaxID=162 RepID=A0AAE6IU45_TREPH|nr:ABC transporter ATP-binding protein [Treponema phagedenis]QEJ98286.1 ABC transporter ATP-binding protein [Treponema phagedenis]QEK03796.1 ABC transporter ATP-binding protein [Treponema phagedenis]QEK09411.1 ABC transporter ATP-binding protein [Treponema phagedenis]